MKLLFVVLICAFVFLVCFLIDTLFKLIFPKSKLEKSKQVVRPPRRSAVIGVILTFAGVAMLVKNLAGTPDTLFLIGSAVAVIFGVLLLCTYFSVVIYYDDEGFLYKAWGHGKKEFRYSQIKGQRSLLTRGGVNTILFVGNEEINLYSAMQNLNAFLSKAFFKWCAVKGIDPSNHSNYPNMDQTRIDDFNMALLTMCEQLGVKFLNSAEALKDANGYGNVDYYQSGDIHLKPAGLKVLLKYLRTHAYETEDRRPDTNNIPTRAEYTANPSSAVEAPSSSEAVSSSVVEEKTEYQADYRVDKTGGGSLTCGDESGKSLTVKVTSAAQSVKVTAVPEDGYVFVKWSDGVTKRTRTDTNFDQNVDVTAVFAAASIQVSSSGKAGLGDSYTFKATLKGKYLDASSIRWYVNGSEVTQAAGKTTVKGEVDPSMVGGTFRVYATASYNDCTVTSNKLELTVSGGTSGSTSSTSSSSSSSASSKEDKPASSKEETSSSKEEKPASSKEEKPASSSSNGTSESAGSSSKVEKPASSAASSKEEKPVSSSQSSSSSKEEKPASSKEEKPASSKTEVSASKEAAN